MDNILDSLIKERDELRAQFEPMRQRLVRVEAAIRALSGDEEQNSDEPRKRRKNVRGTVLSIIERSGDNGITVPEILEEAEQSGKPLEKTSVSTLVYTLKRSGAVTLEDGRYKAVPEAPEAPAKPKRKAKEAA